MTPAEILAALRAAGCTLYIAENGALKIRGSALVPQDLKDACTAVLGELRAIVATEIAEAQARFDAGQPVLVKIPSIGRTVALCRDDAVIVTRDEYGVMDIKPQSVIVTDSHRRVDGTRVWRQSEFRQAITPDTKPKDFLLAVMEEFPDSEVHR